MLAKLIKDVKPLITKLWFVLNAHKDLLLIVKEFVCLLMITAKISMLLLIVFNAIKVMTLLMEFVYSLLQTLLLQVI